MKYYNYLNLQQKLCRIRKKIPALVKKRHSEEVDYDFTKIDDIYRFLTPALNKYGVNFEIYEEIPVKKDSQGNPVYLYQENGFWMYEADLKIGWINADNPSEREEALIHLVGTHEMAEKAKGTAWTYGLKYYLFSKFNIDQGGEDADFNHYEEESVPTSEEAKKAGKPERKRTQTERVEDSVREQVARQTSAGSGKSKQAEKTAGEERQEKESDNGRPEETAENTGKEEKKETGSQKPAQTGEKQKSVTKAEEETAADGQISLTGMMQETDTQTAEDGFQNADDEEIPFDTETEEKDDDFLQSLMEDLGDEEEEDQSGKMTMAEARKVTCIAGAYAEQPLGKVLDAGERGRKTLEWLVNRYNGPDKQQKEAAEVLLNELNRIRSEKEAGGTEKQAA